MNQENRIVIEKGLDASMSIRAIAAELGKDPTTISKEIKRHRISKSIIFSAKSQADVHLQKTAAGRTFAEPTHLSAGENVA